MLHCSLLLLLASFAALLPITCVTAAAAAGTIIIKRGADAANSIIDPTNIFTNADGTTEDATATAQQCVPMGGIISFSHPMSLTPGDKFFSTGQLQLKAIEMMVDEINTARCGVLVNGTRYGIELTTYGDDSDKAKIVAIVENGMIPAAASGASANFWLGPYSSGLTGAMSPYANTTNTVLVAGGAASTSVFKDYPTIFGTFPPTAMYLAQAIEALAKAGAKTAAGVWEDASFTRGVCAALPQLAEEHGLVVQSMTQVVSGPTAVDLDPVAKNLSMADANPDVVVTCVYDKGCAEWIASLRRARWTPRGQVFTVCIGMDSFVEAVGGIDAQFMTGISPWDPSLDMKDSVVGWSASEFAELFFANTARTSTYHSASAAASVGALVQAMERTNSFDSDKVASMLASEEFTTLYGKVRFDANGQSKAPSLFLQYDSNTTVQTVYPLESRSGDLLYPMPTWEHRDCSFLSTCETGSISTVLGQCQDDGKCKCNDESAVSNGVGPEASCIIIPNEDQNYISTALLSVGLVLFAVQAIFSLSCAAWTIYHRQSRVVKASQPIFLCLVSVGAFVMNLAIIPSGIQAEYRYMQDPSTGELTDTSNPDIGSVDAACMALPWLFSMGFSILFSALFAKIWRIRMVWKAAQNFVAKTVAPRDVALIMVGVIFIQAVVLLCWQLIDPLEWQREILSTDANGYPTKSVGYCTSNNMLRFLIPLVSIDGFMLFYALYLCFVTRNVSSDYQEGKWISAAVLSIIQILVLSVPILAITDNNNDAFYFVRATVLFLMSSTPTALIVFPKMYRLHFKPTLDGRGSIGRGSMNLRSSIQTRRTSTGAAPRTSMVSAAGDYGLRGRRNSTDSDGGLRASLSANHQPYSLAHGLVATGTANRRKGTHSIICENCQAVNEVTFEGNSSSDRRPSSSRISHVESSGCPSVNENSHIESTDRRSSVSGTCPLVNENSHNSHVESTDRPTMSRNSNIESIDEAINGCELGGSSLEKIESGEATKAGD